MSHYDNCRPGFCGICGQAEGYCVHTLTELNEQVDGDHYKKLVIQPAEYSYRNDLNWHQGEVIKYVTRYKDKNGKVDLQKAIHLLKMLIELEYDSS